MRSLASSAVGRAALLATLAFGSVGRAQPVEPITQYQTTVHARGRRDDGAGTIVVTARELQQRGAQNLQEALDLIPELQVRQGGMGIRLDLRGAKQRSVLLLIDGTPVDEPYFGAFDVSAIPITDIVEIRVQLSPASPLEGPGGDGGIVEVFTLRAVGARRLEARLSGGSTPDGEGALTGRIPLSDNVGLRGSAGARFADPGYPVVAAQMSSATFFDRQTQAYSSLRIERETPGGRFTADAWYGHRAFFIPPSDIEGVTVQDVTGENAARVVLGGELTRGKNRLALGAYAELLERSTDFYSDYSLHTKTTHQELLTGRVGGAAHYDRTFSYRELQGTASARLSLDGEGATIAQTMTASASGFETYAELALGAKLRWRWLRAEAAVGGLVPLEHPAGAWPEAKLSVGVQPNKFVSLLFIGARKGRLPTIRELYDPQQGNPLLHPEYTWHGEAQLQMRPHALVFAHLSGYARQIEGSIRLDPSSMGMNRKNVNLDTIYVRGLEAGIDLARDRVIGGGALYIFEDAYAAAPLLGFNAIPNFPRHKFDAYLASTWKRTVGGLVRVRWVSENFVQGTVLPRYQVVDLSVWARLSRSLRGSLLVNNLLNERYQSLPSLEALGTNVTATVQGVWE